MNPSRLSDLRLTETWWRGIILALSITVTFFTVWCLTHGITTVFMHLYYFPIVLLAYHYRWKGCALATLLALVYLVLVVVFDPGQTDVILGASYRVLVFVGIAAVIALLSERIIQVQDNLGKMQQFQESVITNANVWISVIAPDGGTILVWNDAAEAISGYKKSDVMGKKTVWKQLYPDPLYRKKVTGDIRRIIGKDEFLENFETEIRCADGTTKTIVWNTRGLRDNGGFIASYIAIGRDITHQIVAETEIRHLATFPRLTPINILESDLNGRILFINPAMEKTLAAIGISDPGIFIPSDFLEKIGAESPGTPPLQSERELVIQNRTFTLNLSFVPEGRSVRVYATDITGRKKAEEDIRLSNLILKTQQETSIDGILIVDETGKILNYNQRFIGIWGIPDNLITSRFDEPVLQYVVGQCADPEAFLSRVRHLYEHPKEKSHEEIRLKDGKVLERYSAPMLGEDNRYFGRVWYFHDITDRKQAEEALLRSEEWYRALADALPDQIFINGRDGTIQYVNAVALELLHRSPDQVIGKLRSEVFPPEIARVQEDAIRRVFETGETERREDRIQFGETESWIDASLVPLKDVAGTVTSVLGVAHDITTRRHMEEQLHASRQLFADIISFLPDPTLVIDRDGKVLAWNRALELLSGVSAEDIIGKGDHEYSVWLYAKRRPILIDLVLHPDMDAARMDYQNIRREGRTLTAQIEINRPGRGHTTTLSLVTSPLIDPQGKITGAIESMRDISRLKETESELARINQSLEEIVRDRTRALEEEVAQRMRAEKDVQAALDYTRSVIEANPDLMVVLDGTGSVLDVNAAGEILTGMPRDTLIGTQYFRYLVDDGTHTDAFSHLLEQGRIEKIIQITRKDGSITPLSVNATVIPESTGTGTRIIVSGHDITRQKEDEEVIRSSRQMLTNVVENFPGVVFWKDRNSVYLGCNRNFSAGAGLKDPEEIVGKTDFDLPWSKTEAESYRSFDREVMEEGKPRLNIIETQLQNDGSVVWFNTNKVPLFGPDGTVVGILGASNDITRQKEVEEAIQASLDEKVILLREVHHRVKNNLQIIISLVNLQMRQTSDPVVKQIMAETQNRVRAMSLVHEKLYRSESLSRIDFADYTRYLATQLFSFYGTDTRRVQLDMSMGKIMVDINTAVPLGLLLNELISNALKHAFPDGREGTISISGGEEGDLITLVVRDNGIGIPEELDWKDTTSLGMRLVTSLIDQVDGTIALDRKSGTTFTVTMKRKPETGGER